MNPDERPVEEHLRKGVVNLDKPSGPTSHVVADWVAEVTGVGKAAHTGTLDPRVTGCLPVLLGASSRLSGYFLGSSKGSIDGDESELDGFDKEYVFVLELHDEPERGVDEVFDEFVGEIYQRPPVKSSVRRRVRKREIHELEPLERDASRVLGRVVCESGTYIRKLCHDIGLALGVGGHMAELRRTRTGPFDVDGSCYLQDLSDAVALWRDEDDASLVYDLIEPVEEVLDEFLPKVVVSAGAVDAVAHGASVYTSGVRRSEADEGDTAAVYSRSGEAVCVGEVVGGFDDELFLEPGKVLIDPDEREKSWR